ncbi:14958_t:CDS:1, partial [Dentiscutata heterogama]
EETGWFHEQCYIQLSSWINFKRIKEIFENMSIKIINNFYGDDKSAIDMRNYSIKQYKQCSVHREYRCDYSNLDIHCEKCDDACREFYELLIVCDSLGNELTSEQKDPFIFGKENFKENIKHDNI